MSRSTKWKLAIVAGISECLVYAEAKYCAFEIHGEPKYYVCPRTEYCCNFGCCVSPGFQIYHLWYYWLLVIIMFLVCSGGGWWYRYWLQGRYRAAASAIPTRSSSSRAPNSLRGPTCQAQQARITYNTARNTVLLHRMWKATYRNATSPAYSGAATASSAAHYQNTSVVLNDANCPYYQLYGPPPSYETVIAQTRGKISGPSSPELLRSTNTGNAGAPTAAASTEPGPGHHARGAVVPMPPPPGEPGFTVGPCFYNVLPAPSVPGTAARLPAPGHEVPQYDAAAYDLTEYHRIRRDFHVARVQPMHEDMHRRYFDYLEERGPPFEASPPPRIKPAKPSDDSDVDNGATMASVPNSPEEGGFTAARMDCVGSSCLLDRPLPCYAPPLGKLAPRVGVHGMSRRERSKFDLASSSSELTSEPVATTSSSLAFERCSSSTAHRAPSRSELRKIQGGSLKIPRRREQANGGRQPHDPLRWSRRLSSADFETLPPPPPLPSTSRETELETARPDSQSSPSNNVILAANAAAMTSSKSAAATIAEHDGPHDDCHRQQQQQQQPSASIADDRSSTNSNLESKRKLDRSRSLD